MLKDQDGNLVLRPGQSLKVRRKDGSTIEGVLVCNENGEIQLVEQSSNAAKKRIGLLLINDGKGYGFIGLTASKAETEQWIVVSDAFFLPSASIVKFDSNHIYAVSYSLAKLPVAAGKKPRATDVTPLISQDGNLIVIPKDGYNKVQVMQGPRYSPPKSWEHDVPFDGGTIVITEAYASSSSNEKYREQTLEVPIEVNDNNDIPESKLAYDPRFVLEFMIGTSIIVPLSESEEIVCGVLKDFDSDTLTITTYYDKDGKQIPFSKVKEVRYYGHISAITIRNDTIAGGVIDQRFHFQMRDLHSGRDGRQNCLRRHKAVSYLLFKSTLKPGYEPGDIMSMDEKVESWFAVSTSNTVEQTCRFGQNPRTLFGDEDSRNIYLTDNWKPNAVFLFDHIKASHQDLKEVEWLSMKESIDTINGLPLTSFLLDPLENGYFYAIAWRANNKKIVYVSSNFHTIDFKSLNMVESNHKAVSIEAFKNLTGKDDDVNAFNNTKRKEFFKTPYLIQLKPAEAGRNDEVYDSVKIVRQIIGHPTLEGLRIRSYPEEPLFFSLMKGSKQKQTRSSLLYWALSQHTSKSDPDDMVSIAKTNPEYARHLLDSLTIKKENVIDAANARYIIWSAPLNQDSQEDLAKLKQILPDALVTRGDEYGRNISSVQQEQALFLYMLALRVDPESDVAWSRFVATASYQQDPKRFSSLLDLHELRAASKAIAAENISDEMFDSLVANSIMLFVPMKFSDSKKTDGFEQLTDPFAPRKAMDFFLTNTDPEFRDRYQNRMNALLPDSFEGSLEELIQEAANMSDAFRTQFIIANYPIIGFYEELNNRLSDSRARVLISNRSTIAKQFLHLLKSVQLSAEYNIFSFRKTSFAVAIKELNAFSEQYRYSPLYQYLYSPHIQRLFGYILPVSRGMFSENTEPQLQINGCAVIGYQEENNLLHLRVSIVSNNTNNSSYKAALQLQPAKNVHLLINPSDEYEILEEPEDSAPNIERVSLDNGSKDAIKFDFKKDFPSGRKELGIGFIVRPKNPEKKFWNLTASLRYKCAYCISPDAYLDTTAEGRMISTETKELRFALPPVIAPIDNSRVRLFERAFDSQIDTYIRGLVKGDSRKPLLESIRNNRNEDVDTIVRTLCNPTSLDTLTLLDDARLVILQGQWRVGKSTVLRRIGQRIREEIDPGAIVIEMNLQSINPKDSFLLSSSRAFANEFMFMFKAACRKAGYDSGSFSSGSDPIEIWECRRFLRDWKQNNPQARVVLLLDEFTRLYADMLKGLANRDDLTELVDFLTSDELRLLTVTVGGEFTSRMVQELDGNTRQKKIGAIINLQYLPREQVRNYVRFVIGEDRCPDGSETFEAAVDRLYELTRGQMFLLHKFCDSLVSTAKSSPTGKLILSNRWIDQTIRNEANAITELSEGTWFDFLWNPFNEDAEGTDLKDLADNSTTDMAAYEHIVRLSDDQVFSDYKTIFNAILMIADQDTHTFQREELKRELTEGSSPAMTSEDFDKRFEQLTDIRKVIEPAVPNTTKCYRISVDLCFSLLYPSRHKS